MTELLDTFCGYCGSGLATPRKCCQAGRDVDQLRAQLEVAQAGYSTAIRTATQQTYSLREFDTLKTEVERLTGENSNLCDVIAANRPQFEIYLPEGDEREIKIWWTELNVDGKWHLSAQIDDENAATDRERLNWIESHPIELMTELLQMIGKIFEIRKNIDKARKTDYNTPM